ncbi:MAG: hypothetical protein KGV51_07630 [Moraxellaceae bacterium]|nr:hypothetical protein [Moraxellaceae bacterium]
MNKFNKSIVFKDLWVVFVVIAMFSFSYKIQQQPPLIPKSVEVELEQKLSWLEDLTLNISQFMGDDESKLQPIIRNKVYVNFYSSPNFSLQKLKKLAVYLQNKG